MKVLLKHLLPQPHSVPASDTGLAGDSPRWMMDGWVGD